MSAYNIWDWAQRWGINPAAVHELIGLSTCPQNSEGKGSEGHVQSLVRLEAVQYGIHLWRNNVGGGTLKDGSFVRWGLANDSEKLNKVVKSGDLIGIRPVRITEAHVGRTFGQFISREIKPEDWRWTGTERELAQLNFANLVNACGGDARIVNSTGSFTQ